MVTKSFEYTVPFHEIPQATGPSVWLPLVTVHVTTPVGRHVRLSLLFDTGASVTTLRHDLYPLLGLARWDEGVATPIQTAGGEAPVDIFEYPGQTIRLFGKTLRCPIALAKLPANPLYSGLLGREQVFDAFGFGFWESDHELYVTKTP